MINEKKFFLIFTYLFWPFFYIRALINKQRNRDLRFLIIDTAKIGDMVCSTPVFATIKKRYPNSFLAILTISQVKGILENNPRIDKIILIDSFQYQGIRGKLKLIKYLKKKNFLWSFRLNPMGWLDAISFWAGVPNRVTTTSKYASLSSKLMSIFANFKKEYRIHTLKSRHNLDLLKFIGIKNPKEKREVFLNQIVLEKANQFLKNCNISETDFLVGFSVTAGNKLKEWSLEKFAKVADRIINKYSAKVIFIGAPNDCQKVDQTINFMQNRSYNVCGKFNLSELPALMTKFKLFVSLDTGPLYIAQSLGVPIVDIVGPFEVYENLPKEAKAVIVKKNISCYPCSHVIPTARYCKMGHLDCLNKVTIDDVFEAVKNVIEKYFLINQKIIRI